MIKKNIPSSGLTLFFLPFSPETIGGSMDLEATETTGKLADCFAMTEIAFKNKGKMNEMLGTWEYSSKITCIT